MIFRNIDIEAVRRSKYFRYLVSGGSIFLLNISLVWFFLKYLGLEDDVVQRNIFHYVSLEIALIYGFFLHDNWTWKGDKSKTFLKRLLYYHIVAFIGVIFRISIFMLLDWMGIHWLFATIIPLAVVIIFNFIGFDSLAFKITRLEKYGK